jgi:hypothetical protein
MSISSLKLEKAGDNILASMFLYIIKMARFKEYINDLKEREAAPPSGQPQTHDDTDGMAQSELDIDDGDMEAVRSTPQMMNVPVSIAKRYGFQVGTPVPYTVEALGNGMHKVTLMLKDADAPIANMQKMYYPGDNGSARFKVPKEHVPDTITFQVSDKQLRWLRANDLKTATGQGQGQAGPPGPGPEMGPSGMPDMTGGMLGGGLNTSLGTAQ